MVKHAFKLALVVSLCAIPALAQQTVVGGPGAAPAASGGAGNPAGSSGNLQYNNGGAFGGISTLNNSAGVITNSASTTGAAEQLTGTYTASTSSPMFYIDPAATASTTFNASGTLLGINSPSGFTGNGIDYQLNNASKFRVSGATGAIFTAGNMNALNYSVSGNSLVASKPTASGTGIGTSPPAPTGLSSLAFTQAVGTGPTNSTFVLTFGGGALNGYICSGQDLTAPGTVIAQTAVTSTTVSTFQAYTRAGATTSLTAGDVVAFQCSGY